MRTAMRGLPVFVWAIAIIGASAALAGGDPARGAKLYPACAACHSLETGVHLAGPSLGGLWGRSAGRLSGFRRYTKALKAVDFEWNEISLYGWLADPQTMAPGTNMLFQGIADEGKRADLIEFLRIATAKGGAGKVVERGWVSQAVIRGQRPPPLKDPPDKALVNRIRHCGDAYFITTADGSEQPYWEKSVRLKIDSQTSGPKAGTAVILRAGMRGDRVSVVFASLDDLRTKLEEKC